MIVRKIVRATGTGLNTCHGGVVSVPVGGANCLAPVGAVHQEGRNLNRTKLNTASRHCLSNGAIAAVHSIHTGVSAVVSELTRSAGMGAKFGVGVSEVVGVVRALADTAPGGVVTEEGEVSVTEGAAVASVKVGVVASGAVVGASAVDGLGKGAVGTLIYAVPGAVVCKIPT